MKIALDPLATVVRRRHDARPGSPHLAAQLLPFRQALHRLVERTRQLAQFITGQLGHSFRVITGLDPLRSEQQFFDRDIDGVREKHRHRDGRHRGDDRQVVPPGDRGREPAGLRPGACLVDQRLETTGVALGGGAVLGEDLVEVGGGHPTRMPLLGVGVARFISNPPSASFNTICRVDAETGDVARHDFGNRLGGEAVFIPRPGAAAEDDGYLAVFAFDPETGTSDFVLLDARHVDDGPVAVVRLPQRVPQGLHGTWIAN